MSLGSGFLENIPHFTFTPSEHQVDCVRVSEQKNVIYVLPQPREKSFLALMAIKERSSRIRAGLGKALVLLYKNHQVSLWANFLSRMTDLNVEEILEDIDVDTGQVLRKLETGGVLVGTHATFSALVARKLMNLSDLTLIVADNVQASLGAGHLDNILQAYRDIPRNRSPRLIFFTPNILTANKPENQHRLPAQMSALEGALSAAVECSCEVATQLRFLARPTEIVVKFKEETSESLLDPDLQIRSLLNEIKDWIEDQNYSLYDTYGEDFGDLIADIPDPTRTPLDLIRDFLGILDQLGLWCADRAALVLMIKIDKLKTREKYERHFLLLSVVFTAMLKIRKICDDCYGDMDDFDKIEKYSRPKLLKLVELLGNYSPKPKPAKEPSIDPIMPGDTLVDQPTVAEKKSGGPSRLQKEPSNPETEEMTESANLSRTGPNIPPANSGNSVGKPEQPRGGGGRKGGRRAAPLPEDPGALCSLLIVNSTFSAKIIYHYLKDLSRSCERFSYISPQYCVSDAASKDPRDTESERKKQEEALRRFRMRESNILVSSGVLEEGIDFVKCNLVILFDAPTTFNRYIYSKVKCKSVYGSLVYLSNPAQLPQLAQNLRIFKALELEILDNCTNKAADVLEDLDADQYVNLLPSYPPMQSSSLSICDKNISAPLLPVLSTSPPLTLNSAILVLNRYCAKLPSDTFTRLTPTWTVQRTPEDKFYCVLFLPINSPLKDLVVGSAMHSPSLARRAAAYQAIKQLHQSGEIDNNLMPLGKDSVLPVQKVPEPFIQDEAMRPGTTKRRQYYYKRVAPCLTNRTTFSPDVCSFCGCSPLLETCAGETAAGQTSKDCQQTCDLVNRTRNLSSVDELKKKFPNIKYYQTEDDAVLSERFSGLKVSCGSTYNLYALQMKLTCPIPEEQNTRGRRIYDPEDSTKLFGLLLPNSMPVIPSFPIYTRSGEVLVSLTLVSENLVLSAAELRAIYTYHVFTFYSVLRLEKYPMVFNCEEEHNCAVFLPLVKKKDSIVIDWEFLELIQHLSTKRLRSLRNEERNQFEFSGADYSDAVIMPWYRNQDQPQYFYVAEICDHLNPSSDFPGQGFETFEKYYETKYGISIQNLEQPLLDVDHTSARLNFLTPRYVNRKGIALPTSSEETKRNKRENLDQKQILVPELCAIHPFSASLWRQTVALPCTMYRLNGLLIADQIRHAVSVEMRLGTASLPKTFEWPALHFGWTLADVVRNSRTESKSTISLDKSASQELQDELPTGKTGGVLQDGDDSDIDEEMPNNWEEGDDMGMMAEKLLHKLSIDERIAKKKKLEIGMWTNDMAAQGAEWGEAEDEGSEGDELELAGIELPDNLTFLSSNIKSSRVAAPPLDGSSADWGTGIESKNFRVGSPTCFSGGGNNMAGLMDDLEGFSCSDSEDGWVEDDVSDNETDQPGRARIEFHGENLAETIEEETETAAREERQAKDRDQEASMVQNEAWDPNDLLGPDDPALPPLPSLEIMVVDEQVQVKLVKPSDVSKPEIRADLLEYSPVIPRLKDQADLDNVLTNLSLSPDLSVLKPRQPEEPGVIPWPDVDRVEVGFDHQPRLDDHPGPSPSVILQALTMSNSNDAINLERLETIGDSFLKYAITSYLYCHHPSIHEGKLSHLRSKQVSNLNLYQLGRARGLGECMIATKFEPHDNWLPPCYHVPKDLEKALIESGVPSSHWNMADLPGLDTMTSQQICQLLRERCERSLESEEKIEDLPSFIPYNLLTQHSIPDKSIADCVEALIGAYLICCGPRGALLLMTWLGITVLPGTITAPGVLAPPPSPLLRGPWTLEPEKQLLYLIDGYSKFEHMIGYVWKDKSYLLQAFSHASYFPNRLTDCYQRLEFLGDAVLDYLITRHLYQDNRLHSPGALTDLRSALVNNTIFACLAVRHQFHKYFKHLSPGLQVVCDRFVRIQAENNWKVSEECYLMDEEETEEAEDIEVPKALGDIFESVAGSIFLDSGLSLDAVWKVYFRMMKDEIEQFSSHVPKSPIRELLELEPETAKFGKPEKLADGRRVRVSVEVFGKGVFKGIGRNYRIAKCTAAKCALKAIRKMESRNKKK